MKHLYVISGARGVGKTAVCQQLKPLLAPCAFLDGDWCWDMEPFTVNKENRTMVMGHIQYLLRGFLQNSGYENVIFCWVMDQQEIIDAVLAPLAGKEFELFSFSLVCGPGTLESRLRRDVDAGLRAPDVIGRSLAYLPLYGALDTEKLDVSACTPEEAAEAILAGGRQ